MAREFELYIPTMADWDRITIRGACPLSGKEVMGLAQLGCRHLA